MNRFLAITLVFMGLHVMWAPSASAAESLEVAVTRDRQAVRLLACGAGEADAGGRDRLRAIGSPHHAVHQPPDDRADRQDGRARRRHVPGDRTCTSSKPHWRRSELSEVPIFDRDTAQELGKFLGVDALIVGEITPLSDLVRIDARLIEVKTVETIDQANQWVPLTPDDPAPARYRGNRRASTSGKRRRPGSTQRDLGGHRAVRRRYLRGRHFDGGKSGRHGVGDAGLLSSPWPG